MSESTPRRPIDAAWASIPILLPAVVKLIDPMKAIDLAYHVRLGGLMLDSGSVIRSDALSFTAGGERWVDQQWLAQVLLASGHRLGGWAFLWMLRAVLAAVSIGLIYLACRGAGRPAAVASGLAIAGFVVGYANLGMRPQMLAVPLFAAALWAVVGRKDHPVRLALLPVTALLVANIHGSFPLILLLGLLASAEDLIDRVPAWRRTAAWTGAALVATFLTPFGAGTWAYVVEISTDPQIRDSVTEWAPLRATDPSGALTIISVLAIAVWFGRRDRPVPWRSLVWLAVFLIPAFVTQRSIVWWALVFPVVLAGLGGASRAARAPARGESALPARVLIGTLMAAVVVALPWFRGIPDEQMLDDAPPGLTAAVREQIPYGTRLLVHQPWASWFEYATPGIPVFVDSRIELYPAAVWDAYDQIAFAGDGWAEALEAWDIEAIVAEADWALLPRLRDDPGWRVVVEDEDGTVLVRT